MSKSPAKHALLILLLAAIIGAVGYWLAAPKVHPIVTQENGPERAIPQPERPALAPPKEIPLIESNANPANEPEAVVELPYKDLKEFSAALKNAITSKAPAKEIARLINAAHRKLSPIDHVQFLSQAIDQLAASDAKKAAEVLRQLADLRDQQLMASGVSSALAAKDPKAAAAFATSLTGHDMGRTAHQIVGREWASSDRNAVINWINQTANPLLQGSIAEGLAQTWAGEDMAALTKWAATIEDPLVQSAVLVKATKVLAATDPAQAASWAAEFPEGLSRRQALTYAAGQWGGADPQAAARWAEQLPDPAAKLDALKGVMNGWLPKDRRAAEAWASQLPEAVRAQVMAASHPQEAKP